MPVLTLILFLEFSAAVVRYKANDGVDYVTELLEWCELVLRTHLPAPTAVL